MEQLRPDLVVTPCPHLLTTPLGSTAPGFRMLTALRDVWANAQGRGFIPILLPLPAEDPRPAPSRSGVTLTLQQDPLSHSPSWVPRRYVPGAPWLSPAPPSEVEVGPQLEPMPCATPLGIFPHHSTLPGLAAAPWHPTSIPSSPNTWGGSWDGQLRVV